MHCVEQLLEARLDLVGVYGLATNAEEYSISWSDASGTVSSPPISWENLVPLVRYVYTLCFPRGGHHIRDPTIISPTRRVPPKGTEEEPHWTIVSSDDKAYENCHQFYTAGGWGRRATVYMNSNPGDARDFAVIKDTSQDVQRQFQEADLLRHIHSNGDFPGVVRVITSGLVTGKNSSSISTPYPITIRATHRKKNRLVIGSRSSKLDKAKSVKDILKAVFDGVEGTHYLSNLLNP